MTREQVLALLDRNYPPAGPRERPRIVGDTEGHLSICMSPEGDRDPNCQGIYVTFHDGRVAMKEYVRD
jgi:hypothetical protein